MDMRDQKRRRGFSLIELLIVISIILIIAAIAVPKMNKQLMLAREQAAIRQIQTLHQAELQYQSQFGRFAQNLTELGPPASGAANQSAADIIPKNLSEGKNSGYVFTIAAIQGGYSILAVPESFGSTGSRSFFSDQSGAIHQSDTSEPANANSPQIK
jgi:type IV pilus assembly protein PilA